MGEQAELGDLRWLLGASYRILARPGRTIVAMILLGLHLQHGVWSMFSSLGVTHERVNAWKRAFATTFAVVITLANISFPLAVLTGVVR